MKKLIFLSSLFLAGVALGQETLDSSTLFVVSKCKVNSSPGDCVNISKTFDGPIVLEPRFGDKFFGSVNFSEKLDTIPFWGMLTIEKDKGGYTLTAYIGANNLDGGHVKEFIVGKYWANNLSEITNHEWLGPKLRIGDYIYSTSLLSNRVQK